MLNAGSGWMRGVVLLLAVAGATPALAASQDFPSPQSLRPQVEFWKKVYAEYSKHQIVFHDTEDLTRVYSTLDFRQQAAAGEDPIVLEVIEKTAIAAERDRIRTLLFGLDYRQGNTTGLTAEEQRIWKLFDKDKNPRRFAEAMERIRSQRGLRERFERGIEISRRYLSQMEAIFRAEGLPVELTRLPLVESCFDISAYSKVGAAGIWQFMPATGRAYLQIDGVIDERRDPLRATRGAAQHLRRDYAALGTWPLALTAYNHGRYGMLRAVRETGTTDIARIVREYRGPLFGFASRNFYAEFLAALEVERDHEKIFGPLDYESTFHGDEVRLPTGLRAAHAATLADCSPDELATLNPAVDSAVFRRNGVIPRGYLLRVPSGRSDAFATQVASVAASQREASPPRRVEHTRGKVQSTRADHRTHRVARGQTLSQIARRYRVSVASLKRANQLRGHTVRVGQTLKIPTG